MIEATIRLLRTSGLSGAGINDVVRESGAPKGSVYHFFPRGKGQLASEALSAYSARVLEAMDAALASARTPAGKVKALFAAVARRAEGAGFRASCAVGTVSLDLTPELEDLRSLLSTSLAAWQAMIASHFPDADARTARSFAGLLLTGIEGAYIRSRVELTTDAFSETGRWLATLAPGSQSSRRPD